MMLVFALSASISFSSCGSDDDDTPSGGGSTTGGGASAASVPGSYTGITSDCIKSLNAIFVEDGTGFINENGNQYPLTYSMGGETGIVKVTESKYDTYTYTIKFVEGFMLLEQSDGDVQYFFYKPGQNLGSPNTKKLIGNWGCSRVDHDEIQEYNCTFNSDGTGTYTYNDKRSNYEEKYTFTYKMENAYVARCTMYDEKHDDYDYLTAIVLNNKVYLYCEVADVILSKK